MAPLIGHIRHNSNVFISILPQAADEQAKLRALQEEMEREKRRKAEEEAELRRQEDDRRQKAEMEARRKAEEDKAKRTEAAEQEPHL